MKREVPSELLVYEHTISALFLDILGQKLSGRARDAMCTAGIDLSKRMLPGYTLEVFDACMEIAARDVFPELSLPDGMRTIGRLQVEAFASTIVGKASMAILRVVGFERGLRQVARSWAGANNFVDTELVHLPDGTIEVRVNIVGQYPETVQGIILEALKYLGRPSAQAVIERGSGLGALYRITPGAQAH